MPFRAPVARTIPQTSTSTKLTRRARARFESTSLTPIFEKIAVRDAKAADRTAYSAHMRPSPGARGPSGRRPAARIRMRGPPVPGLRPLGTAWGGTGVPHGADPGGLVPAIALYPTGRPWICF
ncbi:MAG: hypothetical protein LBT40_02130 [Deltaproteobacteria bacterium]|nr:hypothetical protein [Deltaproteobacteria bacterium]